MGITGDRGRNSWSWAKSQQPGIGAVLFDTERDIPEFHIHIDINSAVAAGLKIDPDTVKFWMRSRMKSAARSPPPPCAWDRIASRDLTAPPAPLPRVRSSLVHYPAQFASMYSIAILAALALWTAPAFAQGTWTLRSAPGKASSVVTGRAGLYLTTRDDAEGWLRSNDGITWSSTMMPPAACAFTAGNRTVFAFHDEIYFTDDGISHTTGDLEKGPQFPTGVAFGNGKWVVVYSTGEIAVSADNAVTWKWAASPAGELACISFGSGKFVTGSWDQNSCLTSTDGTNWAVKDAPAGPVLSYYNNRFYTLGYVIDSSLATWTPTNVDYSKALGGNVLLRFSGLDFTMLNGATTSPAGRAPLTSDEIIATAFCGDKWIATSGSGKIVTSDVIGQTAPVAPPVKINRAISLSWPTQPGRVYQVQIGFNGGSAWLDTGNPIIGDGTPALWFTTGEASTALYRVQVR